MQKKSASSLASSENKENMDAGKKGENSKDNNDDTYELKQYHVAVIGDPCENEAKLDEPFMQPFHGRSWTTLRRDAAEVRCETVTTNSSKNRQLVGATFSDHGFPIINLHFDAQEDGRDPLFPRVFSTSESAVYAGGEEAPRPGKVRELQLLKKSAAGGRGKTVTTKYQHEYEWEPTCKDRAASGYNSGMGEIFRRVGLITPIEAKAKNYQKYQQQDRDAREEL